MNTAGMDPDRSGGFGTGDSSSDNSISGCLGAWVSSLSGENIPRDVIHIAKRCVIDTIAVSAAGARSRVAKSMRAHAISSYAAGNCTLFAGTGGLCMPGAALANGVAAHALDFDDTSYAGVVHGSAIVLPAVLAAAEHGDISGEEFLTAFIAGSEVVYALGLTLSDHHYLKGWWATSTLGAIGAAAGAARALGLGEQKTSMAIALAAIQANGMSVLLGSDAKPVMAGQSARLGVEAALLADTGIGAPECVFEDPRGFLALMNDGIQNPAGLAQLGRTWRLLDPGIAIKRFPVCSAAQAAIEATEQLILANDLDCSLIETVTCHVPHLVKISLLHEHPDTPSKAQFSMPFAIGCMLAFGVLGPKQINREALSQTNLQEAMSKVAMIEDGELNGSKYQPQFPECTRVTIVMSNTELFSHFVGAATGMPDNPLSSRTLVAKLRDCAAFAGWSEKMTNNILNNIENIDKLSSIRALMQGGS